MMESIMEPITAIRTVALILLIGLLPSAGKAGEAKARREPITIKNAQQRPDFDRLPSFYTSDPGYDKFINEYFQRHLSVDEQGVYWKKGPVPGRAGLMWVVEWDTWFFCWIDRGAMGIERQDGNPNDTIVNLLLTVPADKYGYVWGANVVPEPKNAIGGHAPTFSWPWPKYNWNSTVTRPTGWEFNDLSDGSRDEWTATDFAFEPGYVDFSLAGKITGPKPEIVTPEFDVDVMHVPIIELDITYKAPEGKRVDQLVEGLRIYWTTADSPQFTEDKMVWLDFCALPTAEYPECYTHLVSASEARYPIYFPMYLHPKWGRSDNRITSLKIVPAGESAEGVSISFNYIRASYDVRMSTTNSALITSAFRMFMWSSDEQFLREMMPKLRRAMLFMNEHLKGREDALLNFDWMVGKDGLGGDKPGHGLIGSYWDLLPAGRYDIESSMSYYAALLAMAEMERASRAREIYIPEVSVVGPDNKSRISYSETAQSLTALAARVKKQIETRFWNEETGRFCRNIDIRGDKHDYGFLHFNLLALALGIGTDKQRDSILSWLDGRVVPGDTSTGADIYKWRFAPRTTTKRNESYYFWPWVAGMRSNPLPIHEFGNQIQDGGAVPFTSFFEMIARTQTGKQEQIDRAFARTKEIKIWFEEVKAAGGEGADFYRAYYQDHPERGLQQGDGPPGGLGLDREFLSDSCLGTAYLPFAFLSVKAEEDCVLSIAPAIPSELEKIGVKNIFYHGNHLNIEAGKDYVSLKGSKIADSGKLKVRVTFSNLRQDAKILIDGQAAVTETTGETGVTVLTDLAPVRIEARR